MENLASLDAEMTATGAVVIQGGYTTVAIDKSRKTEDLMEALKANRRRLQDLKDQYVKAVKTEGGVEKTPSTTRRMVFREILRLYGAMEGLKNELTQRGGHFDIDVSDHEHPNAAFKRLTAAPPPKKPSPSSGVMVLYLVLSAVVFALWFLSTIDWREIGHVMQ